MTAMALSRVRRARVDLIGLLAVIVAGVGLALTLLMTQSRPAPGLTTSGAPAVVAPADIARDQWYLDRAATTATPLSTQMRDRWYLERRVVGEIPKDRWYSDGKDPTP
jgi:hypothetical protein